jgi:hypothetical protein
VDHPHRGKVVDLQDQLVLSRSCLVAALGNDDAGVVDEEVDLGEGRLDILEGLGYLLVARKVTLVK